MSEQEENISRKEVKQEFQLERMILFSDAVFAIVITLMAIEIRLPDLTHVKPEHHLAELAKHLLPVFLAYTVSFIFIGVIWYQHLKTFSVLKSYDSGLVVRNLVLLFFVVLFPFSATVIANGKGASLPMVIYLTTLMLCLSAQYFLQRYILISRPQLRINVDITEHLIELEKKGKSLLSFAVIMALIFVSLALITDPLYKPLVTLWMLPFAFMQKLFKKKKKS